MEVLRTLWGLMTAKQRRRLVALQLLSVVMGFTAVGGIAALLPFFTVLADPQAAERSAILRNLLQALHLTGRSNLGVALGLLFAGAVLLANATSLLGFLAINRFALRTGDSLCVQLFDEYLHRSFEFHALHQRTRLAANVQECARVTASMLQQALTLVANAIVILCVTSAVAILNPLAALLALGGLGGSYLGISSMARRHLLRQSRSETHSRVARARTVEESLGGIREVTLAHAGALLVRRFAQQSRAISYAAFSSQRIAQAPRYLIEFATVTCLVGVALYLRRSVAPAGPWVAQLSFIAFAAYRMLPALQQAFAATVKIRADQAAFGAIKTDLLDAQRVRSRPSDATRDRTWSGAPRREVRLCDVTFTYGINRAAAVSAASMVIPAGTLVGLTGPNGSGKSTLLDLIGGLLTPQSGYVEVDGVRIDATNCRAWQAALAYVPQAPFFFNATVTENIVLAADEEVVDDQRMNAALRAVGLTEFVASLPRGYLEPLGDGAGRFSGGQRQRLAIARALYRGASMLMLDEATSALDGNAEDGIVEMLLALEPRVTVLVSTHQPRVLQRCDLVFEMNGGAVVLARPMDASRLRRASRS
jgi:ATP-binding cassette, subfamily B, bacterial PglK